MRRSERLNWQPSRSIQKQNNLTFETLEERRLLAGDFIQQVANSISVDERDSYLRSYLDLAQNESLQLINVKEDQIGFTHYKYQQMLNGIPVEGGVYAVHAKDGELVSVSGIYVPVADNFIGPAVGPTQSFRAALNHVGAESYVWDDPNSPENSEVDFDEIQQGELVYVGSSDGETALAYRFDVFALEPFTRDYVLVDARTGSDIVGTRNRISHADVPATGIATYEGLVDITADKTGILPYFLREARRNIRTMDVGNGTNTGAATLFSSPDNSFDEVQHDDGVQVHFGVEYFYDYFYFVHGRDSYDDANGQLTSFVNFDTVPNYDPPGAMWTGTSVRFGDGDGVTRGPWVSLDIVGHEFTHGVVESAVGGVLGGTDWQFDALTESFADIFGTAVERYARRGQNWNWTIGEDIMLSGTGALRSMEDPTLYGGGVDTFSNLSSLNTDHQNAGVQNKWFHLLATDIGFDEAAAIAYRNLTVYMYKDPIGVQDSAYTDARLGSVQAAIDLYGADSVEHLATQAAWDAVGVVEFDPQTFILTDFEPVRPLGSQIYVKNVSGEITPTDPIGFEPVPPLAIKNSTFQDTYYVDLDGNQTISALVRQTSGDLEPHVTVVSPGGGILADVVGAGVIPLAATNTIEVTDPGTYTIIVGGTENGTGQFGEYELEIYLNSDIELESFTGISNDVPADAQQLDYLPTQIGSSDAERMAVVGSITATDLLPTGGGGGTVFDGEDFEKWPGFVGNWSQWSSNSNGRIQVTNAYGSAPGGMYALWMDVEQPLIYSLNEVVWQVDISAVVTPFINTTYAEYEDDADPLPVSFVGHFEGDGVSISNDNVTWYRLDDPFPTSSAIGDWDSISYDLSRVAANNGITLNPTIYVKFQQYDNGQINVEDGRAWDDISVSDVPLHGDAQPVGDWYEFTLQAGESVEFVAANLGLFESAALEIDLYDSSETLIQSSLSVSPAGLTNVETHLPIYTHDENLPADTFYVNVFSDEEIDYSLVATFDASFDVETVPNQIRDLTGLSGAIGYLTSGDELVAEPDAFPEGTVLRNAYPYATLTDTSGGEVYVSHDISAQSGGNLNAPTFDRVFTRNSDPGDPWGETSGFDVTSHALRVDFINPQHTVSIDFLADELDLSQEEAILIAFDANGGFVDEDSAYADLFLPAETLTVSSFDGGSPVAEIAYVVIGGTENRSVILDHLRYSTDVDTDIYQITDVEAGDVIRYGGFLPADGPFEFQNGLTGVGLTLYWRDPNNGNNLVFVASGSQIEEIVDDPGEYELHVSALGGQGEYYLSDVLEDRPVLAHVCSDTSLFGDLRGGVAADVGPLNETNGYLMYTVRDVRSRFDPLRIDPDSADHIVGVRLSGTQWQYTSQDGRGWTDFTPERGDVLIAAVDFDADKIVDLKGSEFWVVGWENGIRGGYLDGDLLFKENFYNGAFSDGDYTVSGSYIINSYQAPQTIDIGDLGRGVAANDAATGTGYLMYSEELVFDRFGIFIRSHNADQIVPVRHNGTSWQFTSRDRVGWRDFTPRSSDILIADVDFEFDTVSSLEGVATTVQGIRAGYLTGDLTFKGGIWNGNFDVGEFVVRGTYFEIGIPLPTETVNFTATQNFGIAADDNATGTGYLMYTKESVHSVDPSNRFTVVVPDNADHLIAVRLLSDGRWQYTNFDNEPWYDYVPRTSDVLLAEIDFDADTISSLEGSEFRVEGVAAGYLSGTLVYVANQWNGGFDVGEFDVESNDTGNPPQYEFTKTAAQHEILGEIIPQNVEPGARPMTPLNFGVAADDDAVGQGYIMYSAEDVFQRFRVIDSNNANQFVAVRYHDGVWEYTNDDVVGWLGFTPQLGDILVAEVEYGLDLVTMLEGTYDIVGGAPDGTGGIIAGYIGGDLNIVANRWNNALTRGEFYLTGNYISTHCPPDVERLDAIGYRGFAGSGNENSSVIDSGQIQPPTRNELLKIDPPDLSMPITTAEFDFSNRPDFKYDNPLSNNHLFGSAESENGRMMIGAYAVPNIDRSLVGSVLLEEVSHNRDISFEMIETSQMDDLATDWMDEVAVEFQIG